MFYFTDLLEKLDIAPSSVRLLRHQTTASNGRTPYVLWRDNRPAFENYQSVQACRDRAALDAPFWAAFVTPSTGGSLFAGMYQVSLADSISPNWVDPLSEEPITKEMHYSLEAYDTTLSHYLSEYIGRLWIELGAGTRTWIQRPDNQYNPIAKIARAFREDAFPGFAHFIAKVSDVSTLPASWVAAPQSVRGVYVLSSAKTREQYIGSATGEGGFVDHTR